MNYISVNKHLDGDFETSDLNKIDKNSTLDLVINGEELYIRKTVIGKFGICEIPTEDLENFIKEYNGKIFITTNYNEWLLLQNTKKFVIKSENVIKNMWLCKIIKFQDVLLNSSLKTFFNEEQIYNFENKENNIPNVEIIYGRCTNSMKFLDGLYRDHIKKYKFKNGDVIGIKSVAGSGKTTTLLDLAKIYKNKKILYIAFNKSLITEIKQKIRKEKITNLYPYTFDALMRQIYISKNKIDSDNFSLFELKPQNLGNAIPWFSNKPYRIKNYFVKNYNKFF
jgi:hypothetical protein